MYPFPPSSFHLFIYLGQKKTLTSTPLPLNSKKKEGKKSTCTLSSSPFAQSHTQYKPWPFSTVKSNLSKLQEIKKVTKSNKPLPLSPIKSNL